MPTTEEITIAIRTDGLETLRRADLLLAKIDARLERLNARAVELGVPLSVLIERLDPEETP